MNPTKLTEAQRRLMREQKAREEDYIIQAAAALEARGLGREFALECARREVRDDGP